MSQISIIGATVYGNRGAEAMLSTVVGQLREHTDGEIAFHVFSYYPERDRELTEARDVIIHSSTPRFLVAVLLPTAILLRLSRLFRWEWFERRLPRATRALAASDALVCLAGVSFADGRTKFLPFRFNVATIAPAMLLGVPVVKVAQAMGPFNSLPNRLIARVFLSRCDRVFTCGTSTDRYVRSLLTSSKNVQRADDVAFLFTVEQGLGPLEDGIDEVSRALTTPAQRTAGRLVVGLCPSVVVAGKAHRSGWD